MKMEIKQIRLGGILLSSNVFMAPMAAYTCYPFRMLCYELGAGLCFTEMVSCNSLKYKNVATAKLLLTTEDENPRAVQLLGGDPRIAGKMAASDYIAPFDIVDINMGCPVPNVVKSGEGSALLLDMKRASAIIRNVKRSGKITTVKCRIGMTQDHLFAAEFAKMCEDSGADMITIHGRSRDMMYAGTPYFDQIEQAKSVVSIPVIANGGIFSAADAAQMMKLTGADGVMIARHALENPFIFCELTGVKPSKSKHQILSEQIDLTRKHYDENFTLTCIKRIASYFMKKRTGVKKHKQKLHQCGNISELRAIIDIIFAEGEDEHEH